MPGRQQPHLDGIGRRPDGHATRPAADEARAQVGLADLDGETLGGRPARLVDIGRREPERGAGDGGDLAREPDDREGVAPVRLDVDVEHDVAEEVAERHADRACRPAG